MFQHAQGVADPLQDTVFSGELGVGGDHGIGFCPTSGAAGLAMQCSRETLHCRWRAKRLTISDCPGYVTSKGDHVVVAGVAMSRWIFLFATERTTGGREARLMLLRPLTAHCPPPPSFARQPRWHLRLDAPLTVSSFHVQQAHCSMATVPSAAMLTAAEQQVTTWELGPQYCIVQLHCVFDAIDPPRAELLSGRS